MTSPALVGTGFLRDASRHELSLIRFPEPSTGWVVVMRAYLDREPPDLSGRLKELANVVPLVAARLHGESWWSSYPTEPVRVAGDPVLHPEAFRAFDLELEGPFRLVLGDDGQIAMA